MKSGARISILAAIGLSCVACGRAEEAPAVAADASPDNPAATADPLLQVPPGDVDITKDVTTPNADTVANMNNFLSRQPLAGDAMPDFTLENLQGESVSVSQYRGKSAVLVVTGSASCLDYRDRARPELAQLQTTISSLTAQSGKTIEVLVVYVVDAHPALDPSPYSGAQWTTQANVDDGVLVREPTTMNERLLVAHGLASRFSLDESHILVDGMDNAVWSQLGGLPDELYLIDVDGKVVFKEATAFTTPSMTSPGALAAVEQLQQLLQP